MEFNREIVVVLVRNFYFFVVFLGFYGKAQCGVVGICYVWGFALFLRRDCSGNVIKLKM